MCSRRGQEQLKCRAAARWSVAGPGSRRPERTSPAEVARRRSARLRTVRPVRLAGGLFVVIVGLGSAAAYPGMLPGPVQDFAEHVIDAPPPTVLASTRTLHADRSAAIHPPRAGMCRMARQPGLGRQREKRQARSPAGSVWARQGGPPGSSGAEVELAGRGVIDELGLEVGRGHADCSCARRLRA